MMSSPLFGFVKPWIFWKQIGHNVPDNVALTITVPVTFQFLFYKIEHEKA